MIAIVMMTVVHKSSSSSPHFLRRFLPLLVFVFSAWSWENFHQKSTPGTNVPNSLPSLRHAFQWKVRFCGVGAGEQQFGIHHLPCGGRHQPHSRPRVSLYLAGQGGYLCPPQSWSQSMPRTLNQKTNLSLIPTRNLSPKMSFS